MQFRNKKRTRRLNLVLFISDDTQFLREHQPEAEGNEKDRCGCIAAVDGNANGDCSHTETDEFLLEHQSFPIVLFHISFSLSVGACFIIVS